MKRPRHLRALVLSLLVLALGASCRSVWSELEIERRTQTSGTFVSKGWNLTFISLDLPRQAMQSARDNVADARLDNLDVQEMVVWPHFGPVDWLLEIIGVRFARIEGTWGWTGDE